jgi:hypothetical protein
MMPVAARESLVRKLAEPGMWLLSAEGLEAVATD